MTVNGNNIKLVNKLEDFLYLNKLDKYVYRFREDKIDEKTKKDFIKEVIFLNSLWFSNEFSDPTDAKFNINPDEVNEDFIRAQFNKSDLYFPDNVIDNAVAFFSKRPHLYAESANNSITNNSPLVYCCFTTDYNNRLLWDNYTKYNGVAFKFDMLRDKRFFTTSVKMVYTYDPSYIDFRINHSFLPCITSKDKDYEYEKEIRVVGFKCKGNYPFNKKALVEVIFGLNMNEKRIKEIINWCGVNNYFHMNFKKVVNVDRKLGVQLEDVIF